MHNKLRRSFYFGQMFHKSICIVNITTNENDKQSSKHISEKVWYKLNTATPLVDVTFAKYRQWVR